MSNKITRFVISAEVEVPGPRGRQDDEQEQHRRLHHRALERHSIRLVERQVLEDLVVECRVS